MSTIAVRFARLSAAYHDATGNYSDENYTLTDAYIDWVIDRRKEFFGDKNPFAATDDEYDEFLDWLEEYAKTEKEERANHDN